MRLPPFQRFLEAHREQVYRFLAGVVGPSEVDDCFQETFLSALRAYPRLDPDANLRTWILTIAYRKAMDSHRSRARRPIPVEAVPDRPDPASSPGDREVWEVVRDLPPKQRAAVVHRYANGLPYREIARIAGSSEEAARQNVRAGIKTLRERMR